MNLTDIVKGMLAPVVRLDSRPYATAIRTPFGNVAVYMTHRVFNVTNGGAAKREAFSGFPMEVYRGVERPNHDAACGDIRTASVGDIGFAFWREPARKLRRVA